MAKVQDPLETGISDTENLIQDIRDRINQALDMESVKLKERAERDSFEIIARAKEQAEKIIVQSRHEAKVEAEEIITRTMEEASQLSGKSREEAAEEAARIINQTRENTSRIVMEVIERATSQAQSDLARTAAEVRSKTSLLLTQVIKNVEQIISQAEISIKADLENLSAEITAAGTEPRPTDETDKVQADSAAVQAGEEADTAFPESDKTEATIPTVAEKGDGPSKENDETRLFKGSLKLEIVNPFGQDQHAGLPEWLARLAKLKVLSTDGYARANRWITTATVDLQQPMPLLKILKAMPPVKNVSERQGNIVITVR